MISSSNPFGPFGYFGADVSLQEQDKLDAKAVFDFVTASDKVMAALLALPAFSVTRNEWATFSGRVHDIVDRFLNPPEDFETTVGIGILNDEQRAQLKYFKTAVPIWNRKLADYVAASNAAAAAAAAATQQPPPPPAVLTPPSPTLVATCPAGTTLVSGKCLAPVTCPAGSTLVNGRCIGVVAPLPADPTKPAPVPTPKAKPSMLEGNLKWWLIGGAGVLALGLTVYMLRRNSPSA